MSCAWAARMAAPGVEPCRGVRSATMDRQHQLEEIIRSSDWLMRALFAAREADPPDWVIGAGAVRTAVWDRLHGYERRTPLADIDLGFFDADDLSKEREREIRLAVEKLVPDEHWDVKNQAAVHLWYPSRFGYPVEPLTSTADAIRTFPETSTCVGVCLTFDDRLVIEAPLGLEDLLGLVHRRNAARVSEKEYQRRLAVKRIRELWPRVTVIPAHEHKT